MQFRPYPVAEKVPGSDGVVPYTVNHYITVPGKDRIVPVPVPVPVSGGKNRNK